MTTRHSGDTTENVELQDWSKKYGKQDNIQFFKAAFADLAQKAQSAADRGIAGTGMMTIGLLGQRDLPGVALRQAQAILRWDLRPSRWSHAFLVADTIEEGGGNVAGAKLLEVPIYNRSGEFHSPKNNGVSDGKLGLYRGTLIDANVALLSVEMTSADATLVQARAEKPNEDRLRYDLWDTLGAWQAFVWAGGQRANPLREGIPIAASALVEYAFEAINLDMSPGASERNSAPEHLWNAARYWHSAFKNFEHPITGYYIVRDPGCTLAPDEDVEAQRARRRAQSSRPAAPPPNPGEPGGGPVG